MTEGMTEDEIMERRATKELVERQLKTIKDLNQTLQYAREELMKADKRAVKLADGPSWVSTKEREPEDGKSVLVVHAMKNGQCLQPVIAKFEDGSWFSDRHMLWTPSHWMPLPKPPEVIEKR